MQKMYRDYIPPHKKTNIVCFYRYFLILFLYTKFHFRLVIISSKELLFLIVSTF